jgi:hypothetical protein
MNLSFNLRSRRHYHFLLAFYYFLLFILSSMNIVAPIVHVMKAYEHRSPVGEYYAVRALQAGAGKGSEENVALRKHSPNRQSENAPEGADPQAAYAGAFPPPVPAGE